MSESDIDPEDELLIEGRPRPEGDEEWDDADDESPSAPRRAGEEGERSARERRGDEVAEPESDVGLGQSPSTHP